MTISKTQLRLLNLAAEHAVNSELKYKHACLISKGSKKIVVGHNHNRSTCRGNLCCSFHAEQDAINKLMSVLFGGKEPSCLLQGSEKD